MKIVQTYRISATLQHDSSSSIPFVQTFDVVLRNHSSNYIIIDLTIWVKRLKCKLFPIFNTENISLCLRRTSHKAFPQSNVLQFLIHHLPIFTIVITLFEIFPYDERWMRVCFYHNTLGSKVSWANNCKRCYGLQRNLVISKTKEWQLCKYLFPFALKFAWQQ